MSSHVGHNGGGAALSLIALSAVAALALLIVSGATAPTALHVTAAGRPGTTTSRSVASHLAPTVQGQTIPLSAAPLDRASTDAVVTVANTPTVTPTPWAFFGLLGIPAAIGALLLRRSEEEGPNLKTALAGLGAASLMAASTPAIALDTLSLPPPVAAATAQSGRAAALPYIATAEQLVTFYGLDTPPTSYGGYGGNAKEKPKYSFQHPESWKFQTINKVQKGTQGVDSKFINPNDKSEMCFAITLGRAGEDKGFAIRDVDSTFRGFAMADYEFADALENAEEIKQAKREVDGKEYFDYEIITDNRYLATVTVMEGKVYAFFIKSNANSFQQNEPMFRTMLASFITITPEA